MSRPLGTGISVNAKRPNPGVKSQLHTPLSAKHIGEENPLAASPGGRKEAADHLQSSSLRGAAQAAGGVSPALSPAPKNPVEELLQTFLGSCSVAPVNHYVPETVEGLKQMADAGDWRSVVDISGKIVGAADSGCVGPDSETLPLSLQLRFEGLFRMKLFDDLSLEITKVIESESELGRSSSGHSIFIVVSLTVLLCEIKSLTGRGGEALEQLYRLRKNLRVMSSIVASDRDNTMVHWWQMKIWNQIINVLLRQRQWHLALRELSELLTETRCLRDVVVGGGVRDAKECLGKSLSMLLRAEIILLCRMSRLLLQIGAVVESKKYLEESRSLAYCNSEETDESCAHHIELTRGLILHVENQYEEAVAVFDRIVSKSKLDGGDSTACSTGDLSQFARPLPTGNDIHARHVDSLVWHITGGAISYEGSIYAAAVNNLASSLLYLRRIKDSILHLERLIQHNPVRNMTDPVVFNLTTMYDLSCSHELSGHKKKVLQSVAAVYRVYDLSYKSFRL